MRKVKSNKILLTSLLASMLAFSCQVGLGEAVDVTAPEIKVTSPAVSCLLYNLTLPTICSV